MMDSDIAGPEKSPLPVLKARNIVKRFGHVQALGGVDFELHRGEIVALVGDNGAGKSTLIKCFSGVYQADEGEIEIDGMPVKIHSPMESRHYGIETVFQDLSLAPDVSVAANVFLGREIEKRGLLGKVGFLDYPEMQKRAAEYIREVGVNLPSVEIPAETLSGGQRQAVAIARARAWASKVLLLDEPTAALGVRQTEIVLKIIKASKIKGMGIVVISHDLPSVLKVADRVVVLRLGRVSGNFQAQSVTYADVVSAMLGKEFKV
ncbi:MAG: sugar ABC transporter ATP-binding protein [Anaerolineaceae bacterium]|nr:sugar ABC transporter ATP-binding protein [Anaerolineaceae bacterium]